MRKYDIRKLSAKKTVRDNNEYVTYTITIPIEWIQDSKLLPGDLLSLEGNENQLILKIWGRQNDRITKLDIKSVNHDQIRILCPCGHGEYIVDKRKYSEQIPNWSIIEEPYSTCSSCQSKYDAKLFETSGGNFLIYFMDKYKMPELNKKFDDIENKEMQHYNKKIQEEKLIVQNAIFMAELEFEDII